MECIAQDLHFRIEKEVLNTKVSFRKTNVACFGAPRQFYKGIKINVMLLEI